MLRHFATAESKSVRYFEKKGKNAWYCQKKHQALLVLTLWSNLLKKMLSLSKNALTICNILTKGDIFEF